MTIEKVSLAKLVEKKGKHPGFPEGYSFYNGKSPQETQTGGALVVNPEGWPVAMVKPRPLRTDPVNNVLDLVDVVNNGFTPESRDVHKPVQDIASLSAGSENEFRIAGVRVSAKLHVEAAARANVDGGGYTTYEVSNDQIEANRPVVKSVSLKAIESAIEKHTKIVGDVVENAGGKLIITSSRPNTDHAVNTPDDLYVKSMVDLLASGGFINTENPAVLAWMQHTSSTMLDNLSAEEIAQKVKSDFDFAKRGILEFDASAIHAHIRVNHQEPNPDFYAFALNHEMGVIGPMLSVPTFSGPFRNGFYGKIHEAKQIHRKWFKTAGYQAAYHRLGSEKYLEETNRNITEGAASSLTRAGITGDKSHGETRIRTEETIKTMELLQGSAHPLPEIEAAFVFGGAINTAILSHYYKGGAEGEIPNEAIRYFSKPNLRRYELNRMQIAVHAQFADIMTGDGKFESYKNFIDGYGKFIKAEINRLQINTSNYSVDEYGQPVDEIDEFVDRLNGVCQVPEEGWSINNYMNRSHKDYLKGTLATHLIAELAVRVTGDNRWRTHYPDGNGDWQQLTDYDTGKKWWKTLLSKLPEGSYEEEIKDIMNQYANLIHNRFN